MALSCQGPRLGLQPWLLSVKFRLSREILSAWRCLLFIRVIDNICMNYSYLLHRARVTFSNVWWLFSVLSVGRLYVIMFGVFTLALGIILSSVPWIDFIILKVRLIDFLYYANNVDKVWDIKKTILSHQWKLIKLNIFVLSGNEINKDHHQLLLER